MLLLLAVAAAVAIFVPRHWGVGTPTDHTRARMWAFFIVLPLMLAIAVVAGHMVSSQWPGPPESWRCKGVFVDDRNRMSLSRLQMFLWTMLLVGGLWTAVLANVGTGQPAPFEVVLPEQLWWALGLSTASLLGTPLILRRKTGGQESGSPPADASPPDPTRHRLARGS